MNGPFIDYLDFSRQDLLGKVPTDMPAAKTLIPEYGVEFDIDDTNRIGIRDYLKDFAGRAQDGILNTLTGQDRRSALTRAGLGSILFGFNPLTAILGAAFGKNLPGISSAFQQGKFNPLKFVREKRAEREAAKAAEERAKLDAYFRGVEASGGDTSDRFDGASSMEEYSADPTGFSGSS